MPSARSSSAARSARTSSARSATPQRAPRPTTVPPRLHLSKVQWDRKFRAVMLVVLGLVGWIGVQGATTLLATRAQAQEQQAIVHRLAAQNRALEAQQRALSQPATLIRHARALGMVKANERAYAVTGLPGR